MPRTARHISGIIAVLTIAAALTGCLSAVRQRPTSPAPCVRETQRNIMIRWGTRDDSLLTTTQYAMNTKGEVFRYSGPLADTMLEQYVLHVEPSEYCEMASSVNSTFLKTQALAARGTRARYIEYINPHTDVYLRAMWNPDLTTFQSRDMRAEYDRLMEHIQKY